MVKRSKRGGMPSKAGSKHRKRSVLKKPSVSDVLKIIRGEAEKKEINVNNTGAALAITGATTLISGVAEGDDITDRTGRSITYQYCEVHVYCAANLADTVANAGMWAIVLDRQPNGALAGFSDIFDVSSAPAALAQKNTLTKTDRFKVLAIERFPIGITSGGAAPYYHERFIDLSKLGKDGREKFNTTTNVVGAIDTNNLIFCRGIEVNNAGSAPTMDFNTKIRFVDT